jgi:hypothetical protein
MLREQQLIMAMPESNRFLTKVCKSHLIMAKHILHSYLLCHYSTPHIHNAALRLIVAQQHMHGICVMKRLRARTQRATGRALRARYRSAQNRGLQRDSPPPVSICISAGLGRSRIKKCGDRFVPTRHEGSNLQVVGARSRIGSDIAC